MMTMMAMVTMMTMMTMITMMTMMTMMTIMTMMTMITMNMTNYITMTMIKAVFAVQERKRALNKKHDLLKKNLSVEVTPDPCLLTPYSFLLLTLVF